MQLPSDPSKAYATPSRGIRQSDVHQAADALLRSGERPSVEKIRAKIGSGSPNTVNPMLDAWWKTLGSRLDSGPAALHRLPESIAHIAEALWIQALEESRRRVLIEQRETTRVAELDKDRLELRSHVLSLREGELDSRLHDRDRSIEDLNLRLRELTGLLRKEQATREGLTHQLMELQSARAPKATRKRNKVRLRTPKLKQKKHSATRTKRKRR
jgi:Plasmid replication region DNA-binding N-term